MFTKKKLIEIASDRNILLHRNLKKKEIETIIRSKEIETMEKHCKHNIDPITLDPFSSWTFVSILDRIELNGYFYQPETILNYMKHNRWVFPLQDPVNRDCIFPESIFEKFNVSREFILDPKYFRIMVETRFVLFYEYEVNFYMLYLEIDHPDVVCSYPRTHDGKYIIGCIPQNILTENTNFPFTVPALDTSSSSDSLLVRIKNLFESQKLFYRKKNKIYLHPIEHLPRRCIQWFTNGKVFSYIDTSPLSESSRNSPYNKLLKQLYILE